MGNKRAWESGVVAALDSISFAHAGAGSQNMAEVEVALAKSGDGRSGVVLLEEPEAHLSLIQTSTLLEGVCERLGGQQVVVSTHSSFVANKLNLGNLLIVGPTAASQSLMTPVISIRSHSSRSCPATRPCASFFARQPSLWRVIRTNLQCNGYTWTRTRGVCSYRRG